MPGGKPGRRGATALALLLLFFAAKPGAAEKYFGAAGGAIVPYSGDTGWTVLLEAGSDWTSDHVRVGGEAVFSQFKRAVDLSAVGGGNPEVTMRTYELRFVTRYVMFPDKLTPYFGVGGGLILIDLDDGELQSLFGAAGSLRNTGKLGIGGGVDGQIGLELPLFTKDLNLFGEARAKYNWEFTHNLAPEVGPNNYNGISAVLGIRGRY